VTLNVPQAHTGGNQVDEDTVLTSAGSPGAAGERGITIAGSASAFFRICEGDKGY